MQNLVIFLLDSTSKKGLVYPIKISFCAAKHKMDMTDDFNINQEDYSFLLEIIDNEIEIVVEDFIQLDFKELADLLSEDFELEVIPSAILTEKSTAEEETKKLKKTEER